MVGATLLAAPIAVVDGGVETNGTPHRLCFRSDQLMWATKSGSTWLRERVDTDPP